MPDLKFSTTNSKDFDKDYGELFEVSNEKITMKIAKEFGPRIMHLSLLNNENMLYNDDKKTPGTDKLDHLYKDRFYFYGGHRFWISPEIIERTYHPDNLAVDITEKSDGVIISAPVEYRNGIKKTIDITFNGNNLTLEHEIENVGNWSIELAPWCITQFAPGGFALLPLKKIAEGFLPNQKYTLWPYCKMNDYRFKFYDDYLTVDQCQNAANPFKMGTENADGWGMYINNGQAFIKRASFDISANYPDFGSNFEIYTNKEFLELETLGGFVKLEPNEHLKYTEKWCIQKCGEIDPKKDAEQAMAEVSKLLSKSLFTISE